MWLEDHHALPTARDHQRLERLATQHLHAQAVEQFEVVADRLAERRFNFGLVGRGRGHARVA